MNDIDLAGRTPCGFPGSYRQVRPFWDLALSRIRQAVWSSVLGILYLVSLPVSADVTDVTVTDVTTRAFSTVWLSDEAIVDATVHIFSDAEGLDEITSTLNVDLVSVDFPLALTNGIAKVDVTGLPADTVVYIQTETTTATGTLLVPAPGPFIEVRTAVETTKVNSVGGPIVNDLIHHEVFEPDGTTPAMGSLILVKAPSLSVYPLSAFVADGFDAPGAAADLNNLFDDNTGSSAEVAEGLILQVTEFRGLLCSVDDHKLLRYRRAPVHTEDPPITELETPDLCFSLDTVCDDVINILDVQRELNIFNAALGECLFNPDLDIVADDVINILDVQSVLNRFGDEAPFD